MTRDKIIKAAINQYSIHNYHGATMATIANEVGIKPASIYHFFENKEELFKVAFQELLNRHFEEIKNIYEQVKHEGVFFVLSEILSGTVTYHTKNMTDTRAYISLITSPPIEIDNILSKYLESFDEWIDKALMDLFKRDNPTITSDEVFLLTRQFLIVMDGIFWELNLYDKSSLDRQLKVSITLIKTLVQGGILNGK